ncbi:MAG: alpha-E domain-containing protein [Pseudomonadota bacterium]|nr:alpha-E domain-containing protein [Pseudomonadota bacterium]
MLLSRVAERVYWQARYLERAENMARLLQVFSALQLDLPKGMKLGWKSLIQITGHDSYFYSKYKQENERNVVKFLLSERNGVSLVDMLVLARENARTTREIMPTEAFELINGLHHFARDHVEKGLHRAERNDILEQIVSRAQQIGGLLAGSMSRDEAYSFVRLGRSLERADMTTRIIDVDAQKLMPQLEVEGAEPEAREPYDNTLWMNVLRSSSAYQMYRQHVRERVNGADVVKFLLQNELFPRSAAHNLTTLTKVLGNLPNNGKVTWQVNKTRRLVRNADLQRLMQHGLLEHLDLVQQEIGKVHYKIADTWFLPSK